MIDFEKLFLVRDSEYGTHVTYINLFPDIFLDFYTEKECLSDILSEIEYRIKLLNKKEG